ncbi:MAG TPA: carbohydrate porin [Chthoniobacteraceae bacterium]|jgi:porin|nr:carbohydrate porin [Chthoniobacteraceae bacterium]
MVAACLWVQAQPSRAGDAQVAASPTPAPPGSAAAPAVLTGNWGGLRDKLADEGMTFGLIWLGEGFRNFDGGIRAGDSFSSTTDLNFMLDTEKAFSLAGGKFYVDFEDHAGGNPTTALTGDLQVFDKTNTSPYSEIFELYYAQNLFHDTLRIKVGKMDANTEFGVINNGLDFLNSSAQVSPTILGMPTTPDPLPGALVSFTPADWFYAMAGGYLANRTDRFLNFTGDPSGIQPTENGTLFIGETGVKWSRSPWPGGDGDLKIGFWGHTGTFTRLDGGSQRGAEGFYAGFDQTLWKPTAKDDEQRGIRMFLDYGETDPRVSTIWQNGGGGIVWRGFLPGRDTDEIGFGPQCAWLSRDANLKYPYELMFEWFYQVNPTSWSTLKPDLQYIVHPGGQYANALVGTLQLALQF